MDETTLCDKNQYVKDLREHLVSKYDSSGATILKERGFYEQEDLVGFCFRRKSCGKLPLTQEEVDSDIYDFTKSYSRNYFDGLCDQSREGDIAFNIDDQRYVVYSTPGPLKEDEIQIHLENLTRVSETLSSVSL